MVNKFKDLEELQKSEKSGNGDDGDSDSDDDRSPAVREAVSEFLRNLKKVLFELQRRVDAGTAGAEEKVREATMGTCTNTQAEREIRFAFVVTASRLTHPSSPLLGSFVTGDRQGAPPQGHEEEEGIQRG